jgi:uncharacterized protein (TIGR02996 family)
MTSDDEAFIRAIVAAPGDDAPRLVYADWLDERGDPRGTFLRSEVDDAARRAVGKKAPALRPSRVLDPVWVARVSRPPIGVCLDRSHFSPRGAGVDGKLIDHVETLFALSLPAEYRALLLNCNGGVFRTPGRHRFEGPRELRFHHLSPSWKLPSYAVRLKAFRFGQGDLRTMIHANRHDYARMSDWGDDAPAWWAGFLPMACPTDPDSRMLYLGLAGTTRGRIYEFDYLHGMEREGMRKLAPSLGRFFHKRQLPPAP